MAPVYDYEWHHGMCKKCEKRRRTNCGNDALLVRLLADSEAVVVQLLVLELHGVKQRLQRERQLTVGDLVQ